MARNYYSLASGITTISLMAGGPLPELVEAVTCK